MSALCMEKAMLLPSQLTAGHNEQQFGHNEQQFVMTGHSVNLQQVIRSKFVMTGRYVNLQRVIMSNKQFVMTGR